MESEKTTRRFLLPQKLRLFRYMEATAALLLLLLCYSSFHIPINSGYLLCCAASILVSPCFFFLFRKAFVLLFLKSGHLSSSTESNSSELNSCDAPDPIALPHLEPPLKKRRARRPKVCVEISFSRRRSEKFGEVGEKPELQRAETTPTERGRKEESAHHRGNSEAEEDAEHFRRRIEAFIEKQHRFHMQESLAVVPSPLISGTFRGRARIDKLTSGNSNIYLSFRRDI